MDGALLARWNPFLDLGCVKTFPILFCLFFLSEGPRRVRVDTAQKKDMALSKTPRKSPGPMPPRYNYDFAKNIYSCLGMGILPKVVPRYDG